MTHRRCFIRGDGSGGGLEAQPKFNPKVKARWWPFDPPRLSPFFEDHKAQSSSKRSLGADLPWFLYRIKDQKKHRPQLFLSTDFFVFTSPDSPTNKCQSSHCKFVLGFYINFISTQWIPMRHWLVADALQKCMLFFFCAVCGCVNSGRSRLIRMLIGKEETAMVHIWCVYTVNPQRAF